ncbi:unnamed protein product [Closterium sp. Naga37s-1]|nr:unnamed protein product [Closterium sp. Naga37s-1]
MHFPAPRTKASSASSTQPTLPHVLSLSPPPQSLFWPVRAVDPVSSLFWSVRAVDPVSVRCLLASSLSPHLLSSSWRVAHSPLTSLARCLCAPHSPSTPSTLTPISTLSYTLPPPPPLIFNPRSPSSGLLSSGPCEWSTPSLSATQPIHSLHSHPNLHPLLHTLQPYVQTFLVLAGMSEHTLTPISTLNVYESGRPRLCSSPIHSLHSLLLPPPEPHNPTPFPPPFHHPPQSLFSSVRVVDPVSARRPPARAAQPLPPDFLILRLWQQVDVPLIVYVHPLSLFWRSCRHLISHHRPFTAAPLSLYTFPLPARFLPAPFLPVSFRPPTNRSTSHSLPTCIHSPSSGAPAATSSPTTAPSLLSFSPLSPFSLQVDIPLIAYVHPLSLVWRSCLHLCSSPTESPCLPCTLSHPTHQTNIPLIAYVHPLSLFWRSRPLHCPISPCLLPSPNQQVDIPLIVYVHLLSVFWRSCRHLISHHRPFTSVLLSSVPLLPQVDIPIIAYVHPLSLFWRSCLQLFSHHRPFTDIPLIAYVHPLSLFWRSCLQLFSHHRPFAAAPLSLPPDRFSTATLLLAPSENLYQAFMTRLSSPLFPTDSANPFLNAAYSSWFIFPFLFPLSPSPHHHRRPS